ncbi:hypothetical protein FGB62_21g446 [Gracilaria domingensis]|nr:hypothetical protein FGB62_21g446 [Gracilaria domingensis]
MVTSTSVTLPSCFVDGLPLECYTLVMIRWIVMMNNSLYIAVFPSPESKALVDRLIEERMQELSLVNFEANINGDVVVIAHPVVPLTADGLAMISDALPLHDEMRRLISLYIVPDAEWPGANMVEGVPRQAILDYLGLHYVSASDRVLRDAHTEACLRYREKSHPHVRGVFNLCEPIATGRGCAAQLVSADGHFLRSKLPLSDSDLELGHMFNPCEKFQFVGAYRRYMLGFSQRSSETKRFSAAESCCRVRT